jgi:gluconate 2-dehydrogenase gamma chain
LAKRRFDFDDELRFSRRELIVGAAFVPLAALTAQAQGVPTAFTPAQLKTLEAFIDRLIPSDELGPGAVAAGAQVYIDRVLAGPNANEKARFLENLEAVDAYAKRTQGGPLAELSPEKRDQILKAIDDGTAQDLPQGRNFFNRARRLTLEGMFGDPYYGGNKGFAGWDLIRYPGPRPAVDAEMQRMDRVPAPYRRSAWGPQYK